MPQEMTHLLPLRFFVDSICLGEEDQHLLMSLHEGKPYYLGICKDHLIRLKEWLDLIYSIALASLRQL